MTLETSNPVFDRLSNTLIGTVTFFYYSEYFFRSNIELSSEIKKHDRDRAFQDN